MTRIIASRFLLGLLTVACVAATADNAHALRYYERSAWMVGVGWGVGPGRLTNAENLTGDLADAAGASTEYKGGAAPSIRFGRMLGQKFMVDANWGDWLVEFGTDPTKIRRTLQSWGLALSLYPGDPLGPSGGIYLRGGAGLGLAGTGEKEAEQGVAQQRGQRHDDWGYSIFGETGYEFWISSTFTAGVNVAAYYFGIDGDLADSGWFTSFGIALNAHF